MQHAFDDLGLRHVIAADVRQPAAVASPIVHAIQAAGDAAQQRHGDLRTEAGGQVKRILRRISPAAAKVERAQFRIRLFEVGHGRHDAVFQNLDCDHVFDADAHRVAGEALGVGDDQVVGGMAEGMAQRGHLGGCAAAAGRRVGLVRDEHGLRGHAVAVDAETPLRRRDQAVHHLRDVLRLQAGGVVGAVGRLAAEQLGDAAHAALAHGILALDDQGAGPHAQHRAVTAAVEGQGDGVDAIVGGGGAHGQKARADPLDQVVAGHVVAADHDHAAAAPGANPVFGQGDGLRSGSAGGIDLRVRPACADELCKLTMAHRHDAEKEAAVEFIRFGGDRLAQPRGATVDLGLHRQIRGVTAQVLEHLQLPATALPGEVALEFFGHAVIAGEQAGEDDASLVAQRLRQHPLVRQIRALGRQLIRLHQGDARFAQRVQPGGHGKLSRRVQRLDQFFGHAIFGG